MTVTEGQAYVDPGTGGMIASSVSTIIAMILGALSSLLIFFRRSVVRLYARKGMFAAVLSCLLGLLALCLFFLTRH